MENGQLTFYQSDPDFREPQSLTDHFLNVMRPAVEHGSPMPALERIETASQFGVLIRDSGRTFRVVFAKDALEAPAVERR